MNPFTESFVAEFAGMLTTVLIHFTWQGAVVSLALIVTVKLFGVRSAQDRYLLSVGTLSLMGVAPFLTAYWCINTNSVPRHSAVDVFAQSDAIIETPLDAVVVEQTATVAADNTSQTQPATSPPQWNRKFEIYILIVWLAGVLILSTRLAIGFGITIWIRRNLQPLPEQLEQRIRVLSERLRVNVRCRVFTCMKVGQAVAVGFVRPIVLIPAAWLTQLTPEMLEAVIAHELAHIRRWDLWVNLGQRVIETLLFFHPAVWWLSGRIRLEREMCCDEIAAGCFDRVMYARSLETVAKIAYGKLLMAASINGGKKNLLSRIRYLLGTEPTGAAGNWWGVGLVAVILPFAATVVLSLVAGSSFSVAAADDQFEEAKAAREIKRLGADVVRYEELPGKPVAEIIFQSADQSFNHTHLHLLKAFKHLDTLELRDVELTDQSLKELKDLKTLRHLNLSLYTTELSPENPGITDAGLKELKSLTGLKSLAFWQARITDKGLKELRDLKDLTDLNLTATKITDAGLKELSGLKNLSKLALTYDEITDTGLKELKGCQNLTELRLGSTKITDEGLKELRDLKKLTALDVQGTQITGTGLKELSDSNSISDLCLVGCPITNGGMKEIGKFKNLTHLNLERCPTTVDCLSELGKLKNLKFLMLNPTQYSEADATKLRKSLPRAKIHFGSFASGPLADSPDPASTDVAPPATASSVSSADDNLDESKAIEKIELLGGKVTQDRTLPNHPVVGVDLSRSERFNDKYMHLLKVFRSLTALNLSSTKITDVGLKELGGLKSLTTLNLSYNIITDVGLKEVGELKNLTTLNLDNTRITGVGLKELKELKTLTTLTIRFFYQDQNGPKFTNDDMQALSELTNLTTLDFQATPIKEVRFKNFRNLKNLATLNLLFSSITDEGLKGVGELTNLMSLELTSPKITDLSMGEIGKLKNLRTLHLDNAQITDARLNEIGNLENLTSLMLSTTKITDLGMTEIGKLKNLQTLRIAGTQVTDVGLIDIGRLTNLTLLDLLDTPITDLSMKEIGRLNNLQTLGIGGTQVTDVGLKEVASLRNLTALSLSNEITEAGLKDATPVLQKLTRLSLGENKNITQKGMDKVMKSLPNLLELCSGKGGEVLMRSRPPKRSPVP